MTSAFFFAGRQRPCFFPRTEEPLRTLVAPSMLHGSAAIPEHDARTTFGGLCWFRSGSHDGAGRCRCDAGAMRNKDGNQGFKGR
jgi:hypothetical protein